MFKKIVSFSLFLALFSQGFAAHRFQPEDLFSYKKAIVINTSEGSLKAYYYGQEIWDFPASVGNRYSPTPHGRFKIVNKNPLMQTKNGDLLMPNWMEFYGYGKFGIHGFPLIKDGTEKYKNEEEAVKQKLGGGCVRLKKEDLNFLYQWADLLTTVIVI